jgi:glucose 1-dehydrogenase
MGDIGRAIALELARRGADIAIGDLVPETQATSFLRNIHDMGRRTRYDRVDTADADAVQQWVRDVQSELGTPTRIIPNAAVVTVASVLDITPEDWSRELRINLNGAFYLAQAGAQHLRAANKPGRIVFVGSWAAHAPHLNLSAYCAAKAGLRMLGKCMARELAAFDILVNEVAPGYVEAGLTKRIFDAEPGRREVATGQTPVQRLIAPEDVAVQVAHLCEPTSNQFTGSVLLMDGGLSLVTPGGDANV